MITQRETTQVRQKQIVSAARKLIVKYGSEHVTVRRMAKEIGVSEGAIYRHFKSKTDILYFLIDDIEETLIGDIDKNDNGQTNSIETLQNVIKDHISGIEQRKGVSFQVIAEIISLGDKKLNKRISEVIDNYINRIKQILVAGVQESLVRADIDPESTALLFFSMIQGMVNVWALSQYKFNLQERYQSIWNIYYLAIVRS